MIRPHSAFDVQTTLAKVTRLRVDTRQLTADEVQFQIGFKWTLTLDEDQLRTLWHETDHDSQFREALDALKPTCLAFNPFQASR
jgi:hypothetical protein